MAAFNNPLMKSFIKAQMPASLEAITLTGGDCGENHTRNQVIGTYDVSQRFDGPQLAEVAQRALDMGYKIEAKWLNGALPEALRDFVQGAYVLVIKGFIDDHDDIYKELVGLKWDTKAKMYGRVVNKKLRSNMMIADMEQEANYEEGMGTIHHFDTIPALEVHRQRLMELTGRNIAVWEGNRYADPDNTHGIGFHGDTERNVVIAACFGREKTFAISGTSTERPLKALLSIR